ncbi:MAG TPA: glucoamylase family protein [Verrucomicrobiae bacterium]|nr:glucoamylase family protein [Verrucomicrobiae bacterium]
MATLHNSSLDLGLDPFRADPKRLLAAVKPEPDRSSDIVPELQNDRLYSQALREMQGWRVVEGQAARKDFQRKLKLISGQITKAIDYLQEATAGEAVPGTDAAAVLSNVRFLRAALREAQEAFGGDDELPFVENHDAADVPRIYAVSEGFLKSAGYAFEKSRFLHWMSAVQENSPLRMSEVWSLKGALEFVLLERIAEAAAQFLRQRQFERNLTSETLSDQLNFCAKSLRQILGLRWKAYFDDIDETERILRTDPQGSFPRMDSESREIYRSAVTELAKHSACTEHEIARRAVSLAQAARKTAAGDEKINERKTHVGYYLVGAGLEVLKREIGHKPSLSARLRAAVLKWPDYVYLLGIEAAVLISIAFLIFALGVKSVGAVLLAVLLLPALECAVGIVNLAVTSFIPPKKLPRLDFSKGIPESCATIVAVPTLLSNELQVRAAVKNLEIRFLGNRDANLHFALVTDPPDSNTQFDEKDALAGLCSSLIAELNARYAAENRGTFFHFHRHRTFNSSEGLWMGWERKRGKILEFNRLLLNDEDRFPVKTGDLWRLSGVRYVITLDLDTQLPPGSGHRLVGTIAHPLNVAVVSPSSHTVVEGYGILQPRLEISSASAGRSRLSSLLSGDTGFDMYTRAVSDVYQDLFGEAIFSGKGIYEVETFQKVLDQRFPCDSVLSHDLIESAYARAGLVTDVDVIDDYPPDFGSYSRRKHRWIRGDWQIAPWLFARVRDSRGRRVRNPISHVSRWKIMDNLRRSLADLGLLVALVFGWLCLPQKAGEWTLAVLAITFAPTYFLLFVPFLRPDRSLLKAEFWKNLFLDWARTSALVACRLVFLFHQVFVSLDAIARTLVRMSLTHKRLLEWETAADAECTDRRSHVIDSYLPLSAAVSAALGVLIFFFRPASFPAAVPLILAWALLPWISRWMDGKQESGEPSLASDDEALIRNSALRTWRFFREFSTAEENWLIPDIVRETPRLVAHKISTTNLGLLLNSRLAALDLGFVTLGEFIADTEKTLRTMERLPRCKGHLYNWYTTDTLEPVEPLFVSTVDNGNLVCCLWTLQQGCRETVKQPLFRPVLWRGILDQIDLLEELITNDSEIPDALFAIRSLKHQAVSLAGVDLSRFENFAALEADVAIFLRLLWSRPASGEILWWAQELSRHVARLVRMVEDFAPWLLPGFSLAAAVPGIAPASRFADLTLETAAGVYAETRKAIRRALLASGVSEEACSQLKVLDEALEKSIGASRDFECRLIALARESQSVADEMDFGFLYDTERKLLSIGFDPGEGSISPWHYDLLPSEARAAAFVGIAQGAILQKTWFNLGRFHGTNKSDRVLLSWTGTMFEYLMPFLWMKPYAGTILEQGARAAILAQQKKAAEKGIPWGMSECSCNEQSGDGHYSYRAFGLASLAIHRDEFSNDTVIAPYATFLALSVQRNESARNLRRMKDLGWLGAYGYYEAADFTPRRVAAGLDHEVVRTWMAHHQGMSLLAVSNVLCDSAMQRRFHENSIVAAAERVLLERIPRMGVEIEKEIVEERKTSAALRVPKNWLNKTRDLKIWQRNFSRIDQFNYELSSCFRDKSQL